jgi:predicted methyltransferase
MSFLLECERLRQRSDYTYKFNAKTGRHGWLRLTPAYSLKIVEELIVSHGQAKRILDPFCGTGTTVLSAVYHGHQGVTIDINPFLVWLARAKTARYSAEHISAAREACASALELVECLSIAPAPTPPIHNIERWWDMRSLNFLRGLIPVLERGAVLHYIVGNSTFYGIPVFTQVLYAEMLTELGFTDIECRAIRKRNSKKELVEYDVVARWKKRRTD